MTALLTGVGRPLEGTDRPAALAPILGRSAFQRHLFHLARLGVERFRVPVAPGPVGDELERVCREQADALGVGVVDLACPRSRVSAGTEDGPARAAAGEDLLAVRADAVYDPRLYERLLAAPPSAWMGADDGTGAVVPVGLYRGSPAGAADRASSAGGSGAAGAVEDPSRCLRADRDVDPYLPDLRRHLRPYWRFVRTERDRAWAAARILDSAQKGVLDFPARYLHPVPENLLTRWLAGTPVTPNQITFLTGVLGFAAAYLLATGAFASGLLLALAVNVLDGVDGKLARVKLLMSRFGDRFDHFLDVSYEFAWYLALGWGFSRETGGTAPLLLSATLVGVMVGARAASGLYKRASGRQIHDHRAFDRAFRPIAGRRNIYVLVLLAGVGVGRPGAALAGCVVWAAVTLVVYVVRVAQAVVARQGVPVAGASGAGGLPPTG